MALEAVNVDRRVGVAAVAEVFLAAYPRRIGCAAHMAPDAFIQAEPFGADTLVHGFIALVQDVLHVIPAHVGRGFDAALCLAHPALCFRQRGEARRGALGCPG